MRSAARQAAVVELPALQIVRRLGVVAREKAERVEPKVARLAARLQHRAALGGPAGADAISLCRADEEEEDRPELGRAQRKGAERRDGQRKGRAAR